jgi:hypothetical protein
MTREEDIWYCLECNKAQGRHDMYFDGLCGHCKVPTTREELIDWLCWNDPNGIYTDEDSIREGIDVLSFEQAYEFYLNQKNG